MPYPPMAYFELGMAFQVLAWRGSDAGKMETFKGNSLGWNSNRGHGSSGMPLKNESRNVSFPSHVVGSANPGIFSLHAFTLPPLALLLCIESLEILVYLDSNHHFGLKNKVFIDLPGGSVWNCYKYFKDDESMLNLCDSSVDPLCTCATPIVFFPLSSCDSK
ncbi:hypothetical protein VNO77_15561 [Canavalia gladiata]|uniref:Uncharacterized protein n=1 Tax=Canavalia gladiata TaxID=3824 RepID=A0AAN9QP95_CANGL